MPRILYRNYKGITLLGRKLRKNMTPAEKILWNILRRKSFSGYKFLRQHPVFYRIDKEWIDFYIADFYCAKLRLIIELDGEVHESTKEYDNDRDLKLLSKGILVVRFKNEDLDDLNNFINLLNDVLNNRILQMAKNKQNSSPSLIV